ncbi:MAG: hypothetical protein ACHP7N_00180 [Caulobacterales bacterium]
MFTTRRQFSLLGLATGAVAIGLPAMAREPDDGLPNLFISPHGQPFRAKPGAPYPVADWFRQADKNGDGKLGHAEFMADALAFFSALDVNGQGLLDPYDISNYEHQIAPEILGFRKTSAYGAIERNEAGLWLAQYRGEYTPDGPGSPGQTQLGPPSGVDPNGGVPNEPTRPSQDEEIGTGAEPYSLLREPEPVTAADVDFVVRGIVRKANFLSHADGNFSALDGDDVGYLTLANLPKTPIQKMIEHARHGLF